MQSLFHSLSDGFFPVEMTFKSYWELRFMFAFYAIGFILLSLNFIGLYAHALRKKETLKLTPIEQFDTQSAMVIWFASTVIALTSLMIAMFIPDYYVGYSGYTFFALFPVSKWLSYSSKKNRKLFITRMMALR